jgi:hypothetical protein
MTQAEMDKLVAEAVEAAVKPIRERIDAAGVRLLAAQAKLNDLRAAAEVKTLSPAHMALLERAGLAPGGASPPN